MKIKTFVINLEYQKERKKYIEDLLKNKNLDLEWIKGIDGEKLSDFQILKSFNLKKYNKQNKYSIKKSEIGCTLSHRLCYEQIYKDKLKYASIIEDDIILIEDIDPYLPSLINLLDTKKPVIILLSGFFFYSSRRPFIKKKFICKVFDARLAHSYFINYEAARLILEKKPWYIADNWLQIRSLGIRIYGISPHLIDQNLSLSSSSAIRSKTSSAKRLSIKSWLNLLFIRIIRTFYRETNRLESAQTIIPNK